MSDGAFPERPKGSPGAIEGTATYLANAAAAIKASALEAGTAYAAMVSSGEGPLASEKREEATEWLEQTAQHWRAAEEIGLDPLLADPVPAAIIALLEAVEDSWLLALHGDASDHHAMLTPLELSDRVEALIGEGAWGS